MAHQFESGVFFGASAWHGLGTTLEESDPRRRSVQGTIEASGLDWSVSRYPTQIADDETVPEELRGAKIPDRFSIVRDSDLSILGNVGPTYRMLQNSEMFGWFQPFLDSNQCEFETAGSLAGGSIVWILARLCQDDIEVRRNDKVRPYLMLSSSHDGSQATRVGFTPIRIVCANTLAAAHQGKRNIISVKHTDSQHEALEVVRETMDIVNSTFRTTAEQYRRMAQSGISEKQLAKFAMDCLDIKEDDTKVSTQKRNQLQRIVELALYGKGQTGELTAWTAYQGLTEWISHERSKKADKRLQSLWFGSSAELNAKAFASALALAS